MTIPDTLTSLRIEDPLFYEDPFDAYDALRVEDPLHFREDLRVWVALRYDDNVTVSKDPHRFTNRRGNLLADALAGRCIAEEYFAGPDLIISSDPPRHNELRRLISPAFTPRRVKLLESSMREFCRLLVEEIPADEPIDYISRAAAILPLSLIARLLGLEGADLGQMETWSQELMKIGQDLTPAEHEASVAAFDDMNRFMQSQFALKREKPAQDLLTTLLTAELDNARISEDNILMWASLILGGGHETTRALLGNSVYTLGRHPDQLAHLREEPALAAAAIEETLRWMTLTHGSVRTVAADTELRGHRLRADDWVYVLYQAANRDPEAFEDPSVFDIRATRSQDNLSFGLGQHFCPGNLLARLEARVMLEELLRRFRSWDVGPGTRIRSTLRTGFQDLEVTFRER